MTTPVKWTAHLHAVHEVSLVGSANLDFWQERLAGEEVTPVDRDGRAMIAIVSAAGKFAGVRFREVLASLEYIELGKQDS